MKYYSKKQWTQKLTIMVFLAMALGGTAVQAMPSGADIRSGQGSISQDGKNMTVQQNSQRMAIDWTKFDIAKDETVRYAQPDRNAISLNRVTGGQQSVIAGNLNANGNVVLVNPNGVVFTKNSSVDVGGLVASTARLNDEAMKNFSNGKDSLGLSLDKDSTASVINEGQIKAQGGLVALHAANVENKGTITNEGGTLAMAAAKNLTLSAADDDKLNFTVDGELAKSQALNSGSLKADGGYVVMTAKSAGDVLSTVVNNTGTIEAKTLRKNEKGQILLDGGDKGQVEVSGTLDASGTEAGQSAGNIKVIGEKTIVHDGTNLLARGDVDGGKIETSGDVLNLGDNLNIDASGNRGSHGTWLLDPLEVVISATKPSGADHEYGTIVGDTNGKTKNNVIYNDPPSGQNANNSYNSTTWIDSNQVGNILSNGTDVMIQAISSSGAASITLESPIDITISKSASKNPTFTLEANRNITINQNITAESGGKGLNIMLNADTDGDNIGAVIMNADVTTNGGWFKSATGGNVTHTYGTSDADKKNYGTYNGVKVGGGPNHDGSTVGTYFGGKDTAKQAENRFIKTNGGAITLNGEVAIGLNGGTLTLDTGGGDLTVTGLINSGNSYKAYIYGTDDWNNKMIQEMVEQYLKDGTVPAYHYIGITYDRDKDGNLIKDGNGYKWSTKKGIYADGANSIHYVLNALTDTTTASGKSGTELSAINPQWYTSTKAGEGYDSFIVDKASTITVDEYLAYVKKSAPGNWKTKYNALTFDEIKKDTTKMETLKADIAELIAHNWFLAEQIAENGTSGGAEVRDSYLATITTRLENSLSTPNGQHTLWVGGRGSGVRGRTVKDDPNNPATWGPSDPTLMDGFYWVTGPEGAASTYKDSEGNTLKYDAGTKFWDTVSSDWKTGKNGEKAYGLDPTWSTYKSGEKIITQPDNNGPFLTVGYGSDNQWDDANFGGETTWGFVQETNLANSSLKINSGTGEVKLQGDIGKGQALDTLSIDGGTVKIGDTSNKVTDYNHGTVYVDHGLKITGTGNVTVGGEIHSGENPETDTSTTLEGTYKDNVTILSSGDIEVHGITANPYTASGVTTANGGKISLTSTGDSGKITLGAGVDYDGNATAGTIAAGSSDNGAVIIDAQGKTGAFINSTDPNSTDPKSPAITTAPHGTWQVYVASPSDYGTVLGDNLNSDTNAQWSSESTNKYDKNVAENAISAYADKTHNKFIFQVTPTITVSGQNMTKTYGDTLFDEDLRNNLTITSATFKASDDTSAHSVDDYSKNFQEASDKSAYIASTKDATDTGLKNISVSSEAQAATATRTDGYKDPTGGTIKSTYHFNVDKENATGLNGYDLATENADIEILRKTLTINNNATQTYGNADVTNGTPSYDKTQLVNGDTLGNIQYTIATDGSYADSKGSNNTAHVGSYAKQYLTSSAEIKASDGSDASANYSVTGSGTITVNPANLYLTVRNVSTTYGTAFDTDQYTYKIDEKKGGLVNGDTQDSVLGDKFLNYTNTGAKTDASNDNVKTQNAGSYQLQGAASKDLSDYTVHITNGKSTVNKATLTVNPEDIHRIYGQAAEVQEDAKTAYNLSGFANGDTKDTVDATNKDGKTIDQLVKVTNDVSKALKDENTHTQNASTDGYDMETTATGDLTNYNIVIGDPKKVYLDKAKLTVSVNDTSTTYGSGDWTPYTYTLSGNTNGDSEDDVRNNQIEVSYSNGGEKSDPNNSAVKTQNAGDYGLTGTVTLNGDTAKNYEIDEVNSDLTGKATVKKATVKVKLNDVSTTYGTAFDTSKYGYDASQLVMVNGDNASVVTDAITNKDITYTNTGDGTNGKATDHAGTYNLSGKTDRTLTNYTVIVDDAKSTVGKADIALQLNDVSTTYGKPFDEKTYGYNQNTDYLKGILKNGDDASVVTDNIKNDAIHYNNTGAVTDTDKNSQGIYTADAGKDYTISSNDTVSLQDYNVTFASGNSTVNKAKLSLKVGDTSTTYGSGEWTPYTYTLVGNANGDTVDSVKENGITVVYTNTGAVTDAASNEKKIYTKDADGNYQLLGDFKLNGQTAKNYEIETNTPGKATVNKARLTVVADSSEITYGDVTQYGQYDSTVSGAVNGNTNDDLKNQLQLQYSTPAYTDDGTKTNHVHYDDNGNIIGYDLTVGPSVTNPQGSLKNYNVSYKPGTITVNKAKAEVTTAEKTTEYGTVDTKYQSTFTDAANGDDANTLLNNLKLSYTTDAYIDKNGDGLYDHTANVKRNDDGTYGSYALTVANQAVLGDYNVTIHDSDVVLTPKTITITNEMTQTYGDSTQHFAEISTPAFVNGDSIDTDGFKIAVTEGDTPYQKNRNGRTTADVGEYDNSLSYSGGGIQHEDGTDAYNNYNVKITGKIIVNPATLYIDTTGNSKTYGDVAGVIADLTQASQVRNLTTAAVNGDDPNQILKDLNIQDTSTALVDNQSRTNDVGSYDITTTYNTSKTTPNSTLKNYTIFHNAGRETITKAPLTIQTGNVTTDYGTVTETTSTVSGLTNGDTDSNLVYNYGNYGGGYLDNNTRTNDVGNYDFTTIVSGNDFLKNYTISGGDAKLTITPKDVYFHVDGKGSTFDDIVYTVTDPNHPGNRDAINSQLPYGETVTGGYGIGQALPDTPGSKEHYYTVDSTINGTPVYDNNGQGTQVGNYVYHPTGQAVIHFDQPQKPDQTTHYVEGAHRPQDKLESALPVFRVDASGVVKQYGTYGIESQSQAVTLSPTGMRMPEPNQTSTQDRKYLTTLKTAHGHGTFRLEYNGVVLRVIPVDPAAEQIVTDGDKMKNVALSEQALHAAYTQMGLDLVNLKGVYIYMAPM